MSNETPKTDGGLPSDSLTQEQSKRLISVDKDAQTITLNPTMPRRGFLKALGGAAVALVGINALSSIQSLLGNASSHQEKPTTAPTESPTQTPTQNPENSPSPTQSQELEVRQGLLKVEMDAEGKLANETRIPLGEHGVSWSPDTVTAKYEVNGKHEYIVSGNASCYRLEADTGITFPDAVSKLTPNEKLPLAFGPDDAATYHNPDRGDVHYRNGYSSISSVLQTDKNNPQNLFGITHNEEWAAKGNGSGFTASVGLVKSTDGGKTWQDLGPILTGDKPREPIIGQDCSGVGEPNAIIVGNDVFIYYIDWTKSKRELYLVKKEIKNNGTELGENQYYVGNGQFTTEYNPDQLAPVIPVPNDEEASYSANPQVSWNNYLNQYLAIYTSNVGLHQSTSKDGINFTQAEMIIKFDHPKESDHSNWISYFTYESPNTNSSQITDKEGILMFGRREGGGAHTPRYVPVEIAA